MFSKRTLTTIFLSSLVMVTACGDEEAVEGPSTFSASDDQVTKVEEGKADSSAEAVFVDMDFDGELLTTSLFRPEAQINEQMLYTIGHLNGDKALGRLDKLVLSDVKTERVDGKVRVTYHAVLQVAWGNKTKIPSTYTFKLPKDVSFDGLEKFTESYKHDCVDFGAHEVDSGSMWYYFRPKASGCKLASADIIETSAGVTVSEVNTTGKYPEYHRVWEDGVFNIVAVFGKYEDGATTSSDAGIEGYNRFNQLLKDGLKSHNLKTTPEVVPSSPGVAVPEIRYEAEVDAGHKVVVTAIMVDNVRTAGAGFDEKYGALSSSADLIVYNGHAGLGSNIRALANKGRWVTGQYVMVFMNGCDTYAYVDSALFDAHTAVNSDDPEGTKYMDIVTNARPSFFRSMPRATMALVNGLLSWEDPKTYEQIFRDVDSAQIVLVTGEQDNEYTPGFGGDVDPVATWEGLEQGGVVAKNEEVRFETPELPAGTYTFLMSGTNDADLYIRVGLAPTATSYDCRPYKAGSSEVCKVELGGPAVIHGMVRGWASSSSYDLIGTVD